MTIGASTGLSPTSKTTAFQVGKTMVIQQDINRTTLRYGLHRPLTMIVQRVGEQNEQFPQMSLVTSSTRQLQADQSPYRPPRCVPASSFSSSALGSSITGTGDRWSSAYPEAEFSSSSRVGMGRLSDRQRQGWVTVKESGHRFAHNAKGENRIHVADTRKTKGNNGGNKGMMTEQHASSKPRI